MGSTIELSRHQPRAQQRPLRQRNKAQARFGAPCCRPTQDTSGSQARACRTRRTVVERTRTNTRDTHTRSGWRLAARARSPTCATARAAATTYRRHCGKAARRWSATLYARTPAGSGGPARTQKSIDTREPSAQWLREREFQPGVPCARSRRSAFGWFRPRRMAGSAWIVHRDETPVNESRRTSAGRAHRRHGQRHPTAS